MIRAHLGLASWDALIMAFSKLTGLTVGTWVILMGVIILLFNAILMKKIPDFPALVTVLFLGSLIDFWFKFTSTPMLSLPINYVLFLTGLIATALGVAIYTQAQFAITPIDNLMFVIQHKTGYSLRVSRFISEGTALILAYCFHGPIGIGTIIATILLGPLIQFFVTIIHRLSNKRSLSV